MRRSIEIPDKFNQKGYAGYSDWQVSTIDALKTLIDKNKGKKEKYIEVDVFPKNGTGVVLVFLPECLR
ncbi:MAG: hypothetical protein EXR89_01555 [Methylococcaceae bacterium]|nr:hypothetical protein [Methylococcaceae bacterium]